MISSILRDVPSSVAAARTDVPEALARLIGRCLEKRPDDRIQTARDVHIELRHVQRQLEADEHHYSQISSGDATKRSSEPWIAVLPLVARSSDDETRALAESLTDDITSGLAKFPWLSVVSRGSANPRYVLEGGVRRVGGTVRVSARLVDVESSAHLWAEDYDRDPSVSNLLTIQDDVRDRIVATIADVHGVLMQSMTQSLSVVATKDAPASELRLRYWRYQRQTGAAEHAQLRDTFEDIVAREPNRATAWAALATLYCHETMFDYNTRPEALGRAKQAATRAIDLDAANQPAWEALAVACFFAHDRDGFVDAAERAMALNPRNTNTLAWMGLLFTHLGEYDRGLAIVERAMTLNPHFPRWYHFAHFVAHYEHGEYGEALRAARRINLPELLWSHWSVAIACGQPAARTRHAPPSTPFSSWRASLR